MTWGFVVGHEGFEPPTPCASCAHECLALLSDGGQGRLSRATAGPTVRPAQSTPVGQRSPGLAPILAPSVSAATRICPLVANNGFPDVATIITLCKQQQLRSSYDPLVGSSLLFVGGDRAAACMKRLRAVSMARSQRCRLRVGQVPDFWTTPIR